MTHQPYAVVLDIEAVVELYWDDPVGFAEDLLEFEPDDWQRAVLHDIAHHDRVSVRSGQGVGKTALEAVIVCWYLCTRPYPKVICTAPTLRQLMDVLWAEISKWVRNSVIAELLEVTKTRISLKGYKERWFATPRTANKPENMQGFHEEFMLFIVDEASGIEDKIMEAILGTLSGAENKLLLCGNPTRTSGIFYDSHNRDRVDYKTHRVSARDSKRTSKENIAMLERKYGKDSDVVRVRVDGDFPRSEPNVLIALELAVQAKDSKVVPTGVTLHLGVDVARYGDDETVIAPRIGGKVFKLRCYRKQGTTVTTGWVLQTAREFRQLFQQIERVEIKIDDDGVGGGVTDELREAVEIQGLPYDIIPVRNGARADDHDHYENKGTESWADVRDLLQENFSNFVQGKEPVIQLPDDDKLITQLTTRKYRMTSKGRIVLERKEEMKKRGLQSPDRADAVALAFVIAKQSIVPIVNAGRMNTADIANAF